ncbi:flagellar associated protein [Dorcoceras hygrometricum]|uniref:Flagellar associated protein n=1 Tax=Dorcoceras hygrometricum TaxID=472368 RepID=A0A2Z7A9R7_9LAMI|nr:flagellar associated protein [Dorcoceras hygrometricum]
MINSLICFDHGRFKGLGLGSRWSDYGPWLGEGGSTVWSSQSRRDGRIPRAALVRHLLVTRSSHAGHGQAVAQPRVPTGSGGGPTDEAPAKVAEKVRSRG